MPSLEKYLFRSSAHFLTGFFFVIEFYELFVYFEIKPLMVTINYNIYDWNINELPAVRYGKTGAGRATAGGMVIKGH